MFLIGCATAIFFGLETAGTELREHEKLMCALDQAPIDVEVEGVGQLVIGRSFLDLSVEHQRVVIQTMVAAKERGVNEVVFDKKGSVWVEITDPEEKAETDKAFEAMRRGEWTEMFGDPKIGHTPKFQVTGSTSPSTEIDLKDLGCSWRSSEKVTLQAAMQERERGFNYSLSLAKSVGPWLPIALVVSLSVYCLVRAIGWVISGFTAS